MPANEQPWRNPKSMHVWFGVSSLIMLGTTIWMLAVDHQREWKQTQDEFRKIETFYTRANISQEETLDYENERSGLVEALAEARREVPDKALLDEFRDQVLKRDPGFDWGDVESAYQTLSAAGEDDEKTAARTKLVDLLNAAIRRARVREDNASRQVKFARADLDVIKSQLDIARHNSKSQEDIDAIQAKISTAQEEINDVLAVEAQETNTYRVSLEQKLKDIRANELAAEDALKDFDTDLEQRQVALDEQTLSPWERLVDMPIIDAFKGPSRPVQDWRPELRVDYNFSKVARFDRCRTCHLGIDQSAPGTATEPRYPQEQFIDVVLETPPEPYELTSDEKYELPNEKDQNDLRLQRNYGLRLTLDGLNPGDVPISAVYKETPAALAGLQITDVIERIRDVPIRSHQTAVEYLLNRVDWGEPLPVQIRRGVPQPFSTHPKLDLYLSAGSPHPFSEYGCTVCHEGQGSATAFAWASHTPNDPTQEEEWRLEHGWFFNHHWAFPQYSRRFAQSTCLKCHHDVAELGPSAKFPDPPAPKLFAGWQLIEEYGCFGCHEINGYDGPDRRVGPDLRAEPTYFAAAQQLLIDPALTDHERELAHEVVLHPERDDNRKVLADLISTDIEDRLSPESLSMADILGADNETPGALRRAGPSLRFLGSKVDFRFVYNWIERPTNFRPTTRMPQFFGQWYHLQPEPRLDENGEPVKEAVLDEDGQVRYDSEGQPILRAVMEGEEELEKTKRYEAAEVFAVASYLMKASQPYEYASRPSDVTAEPSAERGKSLFQVRGCLACHKHKDFPEGQETQGPDLSRIGDKLTTPEGAQWLYSWLLNPSSYHARTKMPNLFLEPIATEQDGNQVVTDPAADVAAFLLASGDGWKPAEVPSREEISESVERLVTEYLENTFTRAQVERYLDEGMPSDVAKSLRGAERVLEGEITWEKKVDYLGRRTIAKYGCSGCHDIPGFEDAKPIGTTLADWGRKDPSKLAFELIEKYVEKKYSGDDKHAHQGGGHGVNLDNVDKDTATFLHALLHQHREGFIWQKLQEPRSYDFKKTANKGYNERLRMPQFNLTDEQIEAIVTFVLGLVAEPPAAKFVYAADGRQLAIDEGRKVLDKYNCAGCHVLENGTWEIAYDPDTFEEEIGTPPAPYDFAFLNPHFSQKELTNSEKTNLAGLGHVVVSGRPVVDDEGNVLEDEFEDDDGNVYPLYFFSPWRPVLVNGEVWVPGIQDMLVPASRLVKTREPKGGALTRMLFSVVVENEKVVNPQVKSSDAWGWLPPPLVGEGRKVQTDWLHSFLLDPYVIRPATVLRMPKFNMSSDEAAKLADYFAAVDDAQFPYEFDPRSRPQNLESASGELPGRLTQAFNIVTDNDYCIKCHLLGDFVPEGSVKALAPQLDRVSRRIRPDFLRKWLAKPKALLPYTGMPENFAKPAPERLFPGTKEEQLEAVVDLLLNYNEFMKSRQSIKPLIKPAAPVEGQAQSQQSGD